MSKKKIKEQASTKLGDKDAKAVKDEISDYVDELKKMGLDDEKKIEGMINKAIKLAKDSNGDDATVGDVLGIMQGFVKSESIKFDPNLILEKLDVKLTKLFDVPQLKKYINKDTAKFENVDKCISFFNEVYKINETDAKTVCKYVKEEIEELFD